MTDARPSDEEENRWSKELAAMSGDPGLMEDSIYANPLPGMEGYYQEVKRDEEAERNEH